MKKNLFYVAAIALVFAGCSQNDDLQKPQQEVRKGTTFIGGSSLEIGESPVSRTSLDYDRTARTLKYMWEPGDKIWLNDGNNAESSATSSTENSSFVFTSGTYTNATYDVYYPGKNATAYNTVTIATTQAQGAANTTKHIGEAGDCGTATATRQANGNYKFSLAHKASYLCFLPRTTNASGTNWVLTGIKVKSDNNIAGNYTLSSTGLSGTGSSDEISLSVPNFDITNSATNQSLNASYMVIAPGTHSLTVEYTVKNAVSNQTTTITKTLAANKNYAANTVYPVTAMLFTILQCSIINGMHRKICGMVRRLLILPLVDIIQPITQVPVMLLEPYMEHILEIPIIMTIFIPILMVREFIILVQPHFFKHILLQQTTHLSKKFFGFEIKEMLIGTIMLCGRSAEKFIKEECGLKN